MAPMHIRITADELARDNQKSVALPEAGGYLGWLGTFHELHCIVGDCPLDTQSVRGGEKLGLMGGQSPRAGYATALELSRVLSP